MNYVVTRNEVTCTKINHIQLYVEQVAKCRIYRIGCETSFMHGSETTCTESVHLLKCTNCRKINTETVPHNVFI